jgi:hypothetical protein
MQDAWEDAKLVQNFTRETWKEKTIRRTWEYNIKIYFKKVYEVVGWIQLAKDNHQVAGSF